MNKIQKIVDILLNHFLFRIKEYNKIAVENETYIYCPNHISNFDGGIFFGAIKNVRIMATSEYFESKIYGAILKRLNVVSVKRDKSNGSEIIGAIEYFKDKSVEKPFLIFPQGVVSDINNNALSRIKPGAFVIAAFSGTPIVPVYNEQARIFRVSRIVYGNPTIINKEDIINSTNNKIDKEKIVKLKDWWKQEILKL